MAFVDVQGVRFAYDEAGSGPAVVLCRAGIADRRMWTGPFEALAAGCRVARFDWRGYGESGPATDEHRPGGRLRLEQPTELDLDLQLRRQRREPLETASSPGGTAQLRRSHHRRRRR